MEWQMSRATQLPTMKWGPTISARSAIRWFWGAKSLQRILPGGPTLPLSMKRLRSFALANETPSDTGSVQDSEHPETFEIVGVARDVHDHSVRDAVRPRMYAPLAAASFDDLGAYNFEIRAVGNSHALVNAIRTTIRNLNPDLVVDNIKTASELVTDTLISQLLMAELSTFFGGLVLLLVCLGLYGSMTYSVARRTREIGVRMALGAPREGLIWMVTREARIELAIGGPIGIAAAVAATRVFEAMLFGLSKTDPLSMASAILALAGVCLAAAIVPVRRAMRVDPVVALRYE